MHYGDFLVNFPSESVILDYAQRGIIEFGHARVCFRRWDYPDAHFCTRGVTRRRLHLSGLPPMCWHLDLVGFFLKGLDSIIEIQDKRRMGNDPLQLIVMIDMRSDLETPKSWLVHFEEKLLVIILDDLNISKAPKSEEDEFLPSLDDGFEGLDVSNAAFGG